MRRLLPLLLLFVPLLPGGLLLAPAAASAQTADIAILSADIQTGTLLSGACYIINGGSIEGCDENGDGRVEFKGVAVGHYTVTQTKAPPGYLPAGDFPIDVQPSSSVFAAFLARASGGGGRVDIAIRPVDQFSGAALAGACFILHGGSIEGCDENRDGQVDFKGVRAGSYLVTETQAPAGYLPPDDGWIAVTATGPRIFTVPTPRDNGQPNVSIVSTAAQTGARLIGACYIINGGSIEGCDENGDGQVDYRGVRPGTYTVTETKAPAGYAAVPDFTITVPASGSTDFSVPHQHSALANVAIVSIDAQTGARLAGACYVIEGGSIEGCDENGDGQVDYKDVVPGRYTVTETKPPAGYRAASNIVIQINPDGGGVQLFFVQHQRA